MLISTAFKKWRETSASLSKSLVACIFLIKRSFSFFLDHLDRRREDPLGILQVLEVLRELRVLLVARRGVRGLRP